MALSDALVAVGRLVTAFAPKDFSEERGALYAEQLQHLDPAILTRAVDEIIRRSKFFPALSEIMDAAAPRLLATPEALAVVRRADVRKTIFRRDGTPAYVERYWEWPEDIDPDALDAIRDTLSRVGEPADTDDKNYFGWEMGFGKVYEQQVAQVRQNLLALPGASKPKELKP